MAERKKLIEVALPLEDINRESAREKSIRHGHPSTLHLWWARRPLAACRAVLFAQMVDDPSSHPEEFPTAEAQEKEREHLFEIIRDMVKWETINNPEVLERARAEIRKSAAGNPPPVLDPFCGGGSIPLEAQRLGLEAHASDLNPVAVLITKALIEIPPKFAGLPPVNPQANRRLEWKGAHGLAEDIRYYGQWMRDEAVKRIGHLYPKVILPQEYGGGEATVIAWIWARTVASPNPACRGAHVPLVHSFALSTKKGKEAWVEPVVDRASNSSRFEVRRGTPMEEQRKSITAGTKLGRGAKFRCILSDQPIPESYVKTEAKAGRMGTRIMAIVAEGERGRIYLSPNFEHESLLMEKPDSAPDYELPDNPRWFSPPVFGLSKLRDIFTPRQLIALTTLSDLVQEARELVLADSRKAGIPDDGLGLDQGGAGAIAYADAVVTYLAFAVDRLADRNSTIATWDSSRDNIRNTYARQAIPMTWDFAEVNPFSDSTGNWIGALDWIVGAVNAAPAATVGYASHMDAAVAVNKMRHPIISTDPPYYDNIGYADLSDFFYIWLRRSLNGIYPKLFTTLLVPKERELVATPYRFGGDKRRAQQFFEEGLGQVFHRIREAQHPDFPVTVYYAFKQSDTEEEGNQLFSTASTGWETMLEGLLQARFMVTGTWPMRTEMGNRTVGRGTNALASSIVLVCRPRPADAPLTTRRDFLSALKWEMPTALKELQKANIAPVDLAQATIGPGMAVFSRYSKVIEPDGSPMRVRTALALINQVLDEFLSEQEGDYDPDTRWAIAWFEQFGMEEGRFGDAETLSKAKNVSVTGLVEAGIVWAQGGKVRLRKRDELPEEWPPQEEFPFPVWVVTQHLTRAVLNEGDEGAAILLKRVGGLGHVARDLAYRLYSLCERKNWAQEALAYNTLVKEWPEIVSRADKIQEIPKARQGRLFEGSEER